MPEKANPVPEVTVGFGHLAAQGYALLICALSAKLDALPGVPPAELFLVRTAGETRGSAFPRWFKRSTRAHFRGIFTLLLCLFLSAAGAQDSQLTESKLKAAFLFNFAKFVEWPPAAFADANTPITFGVLGTNPFGDDLAAIVRDKTINNRSIVIKPLHSVTEATNCQVLFICASEKNKLTEIISSLGTASVLTVGDTEHFIETGGMINFVKEGNKMRFQINDTAAKRAGLKISSKLLSLALPGGS